MLLPSCHAKWKFQMMTVSLLHRAELSKFCSSQREVVPELGTSWILEWCYYACKSHLRSSSSSYSFSPVGWGADTKLAEPGSIGLAAHAPCNWVVCAWWPCALGIWAFEELPARAGNACGAAALLPGLLSNRKSQARCLYCRRLRSIREEGNVAKSTPKLAILIYMAHILKIQGKTCWWYGWRSETP